MTNWYERPNLLVVTHRVPYPPDKGDRIRTYHMLRFLAQHADIHLATLADEPVTDETRTVLGQLCKRVFVASVGKGRWFNGLAHFMVGGTISEGLFQSTALKTVVRAWAKEIKFKAALASSSAVAQFLRVPELQTVSKVVDIVDVDSQKWYDYAHASSIPKAWLYACEGKRLRKTEQQITRWARVAALVSSREAAMFREITGAKNVQAVTNGVDLDYYVPNESVAEAGCVFVGALDYKPNIDGACWFARTVWPHIRHHHPQAKFAIVGRKPTPSVAELAQIPGVEVVGQVPDVRPYLSRAAVVVAPLHIARGLQNKVLEAMAAGKCVVASPQALAGFGHVGELPARACDSADDWIRTVTQLLGDAATRRRLGMAGREFAEKHHNWNDCLEPFLHHLHLLDTHLLSGSRQ
jgi:sugar transferase (PEP-CTERM/EpsH1 system associated)